MAGLIAAYGYWALAVGCFLEGETILMAAAFAAHRGYLDLPTVVAVAALATFVGDQVYFLIGRKWGQSLLARFPRWTRRAERATALLQRYHTLFILGFRFVYGIRTISPFVVGMSRVSFVRFAMLNAISAAAWATIFSLIGYSLGQAAELMFDRVKRYEAWIIAGILLAGVAVWLVHWLWQRRR
jgi:membrane protein DedA with SNARE-associated domain